MADWDPGQTFGGNGGDYHVGKLADHAQKHLKPARLAVSDLKHNLVGDDKLSADETLWGRAFRKRAKRAHLKHPLLVQRDAEGKHWVMDGSHRLGKAMMKGHEHVNAYVFRHDQMPDHAKVEENLMQRAPLILEFRDKLAFRGGVLNRNTPGQDHWLPKHIRPTHHEAPRKEATEPKKRRAGDPLRDEPKRIGLTAKARMLRRSLRKKRSKRHGHLVSDAALDLTRAELLLDHDKPT